MPEQTITVDTIADAIEGRRYLYANELILQAGLKAAMDDAKLPARSEVQLGSAGRIDFLVGRVGVEVKVQGGAPAVYRQLVRYAKRSEVDALLLVTTRRTHRAMPDQAGGKPIHVLVIGGAA